MINLAAFIGAMALALLLTPAPARELTANEVREQTRQRVFHCNIRYVSRGARRQHCWTR
jgi:hypothetical protein